VRDEHGELEQQLVRLAIRWQLRGAGDISHSRTDAADPADGFRSNRAIRHEFRSLCDRYKTRSLIVEHL
jgi:hypothetical protein